MAQILGYLSFVEAVDFQLHAASGGLDASALANLLIARELNLARLSELRGEFCVDAVHPDRKKIVAHVRDDSTKVSFARAAAEAGLKPSPAAAILFRAELKERWLSHCLKVDRLDSV